MNESGAASRQWNSDHFFLGAGDLERDALAGDLVGGDLAGGDLAGVDLVGAGDLERDALPLPVAGAMTFCVPPATTLYQSAAGSSQHSAMARMGAAASRLSIEPVLRMRSGKKSCESCVRNGTSVTQGTTQTTNVSRDHRSAFSIVRPCL